MHGIAHFDMLNIHNLTQMLINEIRLRSCDNQNWGHEISDRQRDRRQYKADLWLATEAVALANAETAYWKARCADAEDRLINIKLFGKS